MIETNTIQIFTTENYITSKWSGCSTTQLYIYPESSQYHLQNFDFRISSAKIESNETVFTELKNYNRELMVLNGQIKLIHENHHSKTLNTFESDSFSGGWKTTSIGKGIDFNLMVREPFRGELSHLELKANHRIEIKRTPHIKCMALYLVSGEIYAEINDKLVVLKKENIVVLNIFSAFSCHLQAQKKSDLIIAKIGI
ncbi:MAG: HutD family protein [Flavobacteriales bacterium]|nr:HutD family protein [Flavobacteriales bacterium]